MNFLLWLVVGGIVGWIASMIVRTEIQRDLARNVGVGVAGSMLGGWLLAPLLGAGEIEPDDFSFTGLVASLVGAIVLLKIVNLLRRSRLH